METTQRTKLDINPPVEGETEVEAYRRRLMNSFKSGKNIETQKLEENAEARKKEQEKAELALSQEIEDTKRKMTEKSTLQSQEGALLSHGEENIGRNPEEVVIGKRTDEQIGRE
jgi:hypothetical protein